MDIGVSPLHSVTHLIRDHWYSQRLLGQKYLASHVNQEMCLDIATFLPCMIRSMPTDPIYKPGGNLFDIPKEVWIGKMLVESAWHACSIPFVIDSLMFPPESSRRGWKALCTTGCTGGVPTYLGFPSWLEGLMKAPRWLKTLETLWVIIIIPSKLGNIWEYNMI
jgi:hypothetical protein